MVKSVFLRALFPALLAACVFGGVAVVTSPAFWTGTSSTTADLKKVGSYLAQHLADDGDVLTVTKQSETKKGAVIEHSYGFGEREFEQTYDTIEYLTLVAKTDSITIDDIIGNRGNCPLHGESFLTYPVQLKFGQSLKLSITCDNLIEVEAKTSAGPITFNWDK